MDKKKTALNLILDDLYEHLYLTNKELVEAHARKEITSTAWQYARTHLGEMETQLTYIKLALENK